MPDSIPHFDDAKLAQLGALPFHECAAKLARYFVDDKFSDDDLGSLCAGAYDFSLPLKTLSGEVLDPAMPEPNDEYILELFHGPTLAFKDFAARFMGRAASHLMGSTNDTRTILVATSGDTGGAIGHAFFKPTWYSRVYFVSRRRGKFSSRTSTHLYGGKFKCQSYCR